MTHTCLIQGLRIAPPEAPVTGYMFGKGIYFADMVSKSANYCCTNRTNNTGEYFLIYFLGMAIRKIFGPDSDSSNILKGFF